MATGPTIPISQLALAVSARLQDPANTFWNLTTEVYTSLIEGLSELLLLVGRPTIQYNLPLSLVPNTVWQPMPPNIFAITDIHTALSYRLWKTSLHSLDFLQASWGPTWETDVADTPQRWAPLGLNYFIVHPAPSTAITVTVAGLTYPVTTQWPPTGAELIPFHEEFIQAMELYATFYNRQKDQTDDAGEAGKLYQNFLDIAQRMGSIEDRKDPDIFSASTGVMTAPSIVTRRG